MPIATTDGVPFIQARATLSGLADEAHLLLLDDAKPGLVGIAAGRTEDADFADCLLAARAAQLGRSRFLTFDAGAARLPGVELLA